MFAAFLTLALLVPAILLLVIRLSSSILPPAASWLSAFGERHGLALSLVEAAFWLALFGRQVAAAADWPEPFTPSADLFLAATALVRAWRHRPGRSCPLDRRARTTA